MQKEKITSLTVVRNIEIEENKLKSFDKKCFRNNSFRVYDGEFAGVQYYLGNIGDDEGYKQAEENLALRRPYKFSLETGSRHRDKTEKEYSDKELMDITREALEYLQTHFPDFRIGGSVTSRKVTDTMQNSLGLDYSNTDCIVDISIDYKHKDSKDISDGWFSLGQRTFDMKKLTDMAGNYLSAYTVQAELPEELILQQQYYTYLAKFYHCLNAENIALGTSLLTGKVGEKVFSDDFTLVHDVSDEAAWFTTFYDGEGVVLPEDKFVYIENGVVRSGFADKHTADKYGVPHTGSAGSNMTDIPFNGNVNFKVKPSDKTVKELLDGRLTVVPVIAAGGDFNDKGEYVTPVQKAFLCDGERFIGRLPEFTLKGSMFDFFGKDFIGVGSDKPVFNDYQMLARMQYSK